MEQEFESLRKAIRLDRRKFADMIDERLRGTRQRLDRRDRCLRALVARYGWTLVRTTAVELVAEAAR